VFVSGDESGDEADMEQQDDNNEKDFGKEFDD
jgi:hypothetical protein